MFGQIQLWLNIQKSSVFGQISVSPQYVNLKVQEMPQLGPFHVSLRLWSGKPWRKLGGIMVKKPRGLDRRGLIPQVYDSLIMVNLSKRGLNTIKPPKPLSVS